MEATELLSAGALIEAEHGQAAGEVIVGDSELVVLEASQEALGEDAELIMVWHVLLLARGRTYVCQ